MKSVTVAWLFLSLIFSTSGVFADEGPNDDSQVKWVGEIQDSRTSHTTEHWHLLKFVREEDGKVYDIVESPALTKIHHETERNYRVEIEGEITSQFLFWGGNLRVKSFKILSAVGERNPHVPPQRSERTTNQRR